MGSGATLLREDKRKRRERVAGLRCDLGSLNSEPESPLCTMGVRRVRSEQRSPDSLRQWLMFMNPLTQQWVLSWSPLAGSSPLSASPGLSEVLVKPSAA